MTITPSEARRRALLAAAKVSLSLSVAGCGSPATSAPAGQASTPGGQACDATPRETYSKDSLRCCRAVVDEVNALQTAAHAAASPSSPFQQPALTPLQQDCCALAIDAVDYQTGASAELDYMKVYTCCMFPRDDQHPRPPVTRSTQAPGPRVCMPWGPPMPPALPAHLLASDAERSSTMSVLTWGRGGSCARSTKPKRV